MDKFPRKFRKLLDINRIMRKTPNMDKLKVELINSKMKGNSLVATKKIKRKEIIAYYKVTVFDFEEYDSPTDNIYTFNVYDKKGYTMDELIADIDEESFPKPINNITFWAPFANEPSLTEEANSEMDYNIKYNYKNIKRKKAKPGDVMIYKLIATKNINPGDEIMWYYGKDYIRDYEVNPND